MKLKVCGMKYQENIRQINALSPDYMGFIFHEASPRHLTISLPSIDPRIKKVGVFVDSPVETILEKVASHKLNLVQLHGQESPEICKKLRKKVAVIKSFSISEYFDFKSLNDYENCCQYFLFDTKGLFAGGNGFAFNWDLLLKYPSSKSFFLSGGIGLEDFNKLKDFIETSQLPIHAIDVNSKFETAPGLKDVREVEAFKNLLKRI